MKKKGPILKRWRKGPILKRWRKGPILKKWRKGEEKNSRRDKLRANAPRRDSSNANELCQPALSDLFINQDIFVETFVCTSEVFHLWIWNLMEVDSQQALALTLAWYVFDLIGVYLDMCLKDICLARWTRREQKPHNTVSFVSAFHWKGKENRNGKQRNSLELSVTWIM